MSNSKRTAFVLSGGGAAGSYQMGCIKALLEKGIEPDFITANSAGALNAAGLSYGGVKQLETMWRSITSRKDVFADRFLGFAPMLFGSNSLWTSKPLRKLISSVMEGRRAKYPIYVNYVSLKDGKLYQASNYDPGFSVDDVLASASLPIITEPVKGHLVDGGVRENTPLKKSIDLGAERIFVFLNSPRDRKISEEKEIKGVKEVAARTLEIMSDEMHWNDIELCEFYNEAGIGRKVEIHWIAPTVRKVGTLDFTRDKISQGILQGYTDAKNYIKENNL